MGQVRSRQFLVAASAVLVAPFGGAQPAAAAELSWTPCHRLEMARLLEMCHACTAKGLGWRFYVSRDGALTQCSRDPQAKSGLYRPAWEEEEQAERREVEPPRAVPRKENPAREQIRAREKTQSHGPSLRPSASPPTASNAPASVTTTAGTKRSGSAQESNEIVRSARSEASAALPQSAKHKRTSSLPPQTRHEAVRQREDKKSASERRATHE